MVLKARLSLGLFGQVVWRRVLWPNHGYDINNSVSAQPQTHTYKQRVCKRPPHVYLFYASKARLSFQQQLQILFQHL